MKIKQAIFYIFSCTTNFNGTRCEHKIREEEPVPSTTTAEALKRKSSTTSHVIYAVSVVVIIMLCLAGVYLLIQKGFFDGLNIDILNRIRGYRSSGQQHAGPSSSSINTNMFFNKLEDEQAIVYNDGL